MKINWFILQFSMLFMFSVRSCMTFFLHFYPLPLVQSFSDSQQWLGLPSLFGLQKIIVFGSVIMYLALYFLLSTFFCFFFFFFFLFMWNFHTGFVSTAHRGSTAAKFPHSIRTTSDPAMCTASLVQAAFNCFETSISLLSPAHLPFLLSFQWQLQLEVMLY